MRIFLCKNLIFRPRWTGVRNGPFEGDSHFHVFHLFFRASMFFHFSFFFQICFIASISASVYTRDVASVVGVLWKCGVLMREGGIAGIGSGHQLGREHDSTLRSGVEAPRGATAPSRKKTERLQIRLLLLLFWTRVIQQVYVNILGAKLATRALDDQQLLAIEGSQKMHAPRADVQMDGVRKIPHLCDEKTPPTAI